ncbi:DUF2147 domain-containing protein [Dyella koreensis]|uniref:DUF2147 domain-containing protein n=1 Tax=Dyella koreensis TaxID=311235 RepID=A0ABW8KA23_9GAMM
MKPLIRLAVATGLLLGAGAAFAASNSPVGTWKTIDDKTHQPKSIVQITEVNGELQGKVLQVLQSDEGPHPTCKECDGERKDKPVEGMVIMWGVKPDGDEWDGGKILDPKNGKTYKVKLKTIENGTKLDVHGYIGFSLLGRSQVWVRQE